MWWIQNIPTFAQRAKQAKSSCKHQLGQVLFLCEIYHQAHTVCRYISQEALLKVERRRQEPSYRGPPIGIPAKPSGAKPPRGALSPAIAGEGACYLRGKRQLPRTLRGPPTGLAKGEARCACAWFGLQKPSAKSSCIQPNRRTDLQRNRLRKIPTFLPPGGNRWEVLARYPPDGMQETFLSLGIMLQSRLSYRPLLQRNLQCW